MDLCVPTYDGASVYFLQPSYCDQMSLLYDEEGNVSCSPDGGLTGKGDGRCPTFRTTDQAIIIWQREKRFSF
jgi:hypothetical protein